VGAELLLVLLATIGLLVLYLLFWPVSPKPVGKFVAPYPPTLTGQYEKNNCLQAVERLGDGHCFGPESIAFDEIGRIFAGMADGRIMRFDSNGNNAELFVNTGGRPLGLAFDVAENLIVADIEKGLLSVSPQGDIVVLATSAVGQPTMFANDLDKAADGTIYFSDFQYYADKDGLDDFLDGRPLTRLLAYDPRNKETHVIRDGLFLANDVALGPNDAFVLVNEFLAYRITRYWLTGTKKGQSDYFIENLPGMPDNISFNGRDTFWLALFGPRNPIMEKLQANPRLRGVGKRLPLILSPNIDMGAYGFVLGLDIEGNIKHNFQDPSGEFAAHITSAYEHEGSLYMGNMGDTAIKKLTLTI